MVPLPPLSLIKYDAIVVGGGPAGLAAGMHLSRAGYRTLLMERGELGGQARRIEWIENYPGFPAGIRGRDLMALCLAQARRWGLKFLRGEARSIIRQNGSFKIMRPKRPALRCRAVLCCSGAEFKRLDIPGEDKFRGCGVYHAAFEEAPRFRDKAVAVVGAGEAALHQAIWLSKFASRVFLLSRGPNIKAHRLLKRRMAQHPNLVHIPNTAVDEIEGRSRLERIVVRDTVGGRRRSLNVAGLFVLIGKQETTSLNGHGKWPGYFTAGDAAGDICRQVIVAAGRGVEAAVKCIRYLEGWNSSRDRA